MFEKFLTGLAWVGHYCGVVFLWVFFVLSVMIMGLLICVSFHVFAIEGFLNVDNDARQLAVTGVVLPVMLFGAWGHIYLHEKGELS